MPFYLRYGRTITCIVSALIAVGILLGISGLEGDIYNIRLAEFFGFAATLYLYIALLISPFYFVFPKAPFRPVMLHVRRAIGISTFIFAFIHADVAFFHLLRGFDGLPFLTARQTADIWLSAIALFILFLMAGTSFDYFFKKMGKWWGRLHRFVYMAGTIILIHVVAIGSHFTNLSRTIPVIFMTLVFGLLSLQSFRFAKLVERKTGKPQLYRPLLAILIFILLCAYFYILFIAKSASIHRH
jgi:sulfoxide reductase heme-binding subunit YedZ